MDTPIILLKHLCFKKESGVFVLFLVYLFVCVMRLIQGLAIESVIISIKCFVCLHNTVG